MTIFRMYVENGHRTGFWVQHRDWQSACAQIVSVGGHQSGHLPGRPPLFGSPAVRVRWHDVRSGRPVAPPTDRDGPELVADPADAGFAFVAEPAWARDASAKPYVPVARPPTAAADTAPAAPAAADPALAMVVSMASAPAVGPEVP